MAVDDYNPNSKWFDRLAMAAFIFIALPAIGAIAVVGLVFAVMGFIWLFQNYGQVFEVLVYYVLAGAIGLVVCLIVGTIWESWMASKGRQP